MNLSNISAADITPVANEHVVKRFAASNNKDYILTKGVNAKFPESNEVVLSLCSKDRLGDTYEKIAMKVESPTEGYIEWLDFKKDEHITMYRDEVKSANNKKAWKFGQIEMFLGFINAFFGKKKDGTFEGNFQILKEGRFSAKDFTPKEKRAIRLLNKLI